MERRTVILIIAIFMLVIAGMFVFAYIMRTNNATPEPTNDQAAATSTPYDSITRVDAKHFYIDGTHTIAGSIPLPTPCDLLATDATVAESAPEQVMIDFSVINHADSCAQVVTDARFMVSFDASQAAKVGARFMGRQIELNLIPAAPGETPEDFELFIKG